MSQNKEHNQDQDPSKSDNDNDINRKSNLQDEMVWVGIGASAGGLEALRSFVGVLPEHSNMTYVVVQHLSPQHRSMLVDLIGRETSILVKEIKNKERAKTNVVYITPPNKDAYVKDGRLYLKEPRESIGPKPSVDYFFNSLAEDANERAIGVILSGTGSDGSHGIRAIRAAGGITIAQDEQTAKYNGMPGSAVGTGCIDLVLPPQEIAKELANITKSPRNFNAIQKKDEHLDILGKLLQKLRKRSGVDFKDYKPNTMHRRIERRMAARSMEDIEEYLEYVNKNTEELDLLFQDMLISVTSFFRDKDSFKALNEQLTHIIEKKSVEDRIRIWIPGCATGEEAYSIAISLAENLGGVRAFEERNIQIFATDLDSDALEVARKGVYPEVSIEGISPNIVKQYFRQNTNNFEVSKLIRDRIVFAKHNVFEDPPFSRIDLITCRNLLIYFNSHLQKKVLNIFHYSLNNKGLLFLGKSESLGQAEEMFHVVDSKHKIYKRKILAGKDSQHFASALYPVLGAKAGLITKKDPLASQGVPDAIIKATNPHSLLVNDSMDIRHVYGDVRNFTQLQSGQTTLNVMNLVKKEYQQEIRALVYKSLRQSTVSTGQPKKISLDGTPHIVQIKIIPLDVTEPSEKLLLVTFTANEYKGSETEGKEIHQDDARINELEQELNSTKEHLQTVIEELETSNEELQSLNEELQSSNEELQSSNEELETSNEELQSTNEELTTVNEELQMRSNKELDDFAYITSHDLKEPIRGIRNYSEFLLEDYGDKINDDATKKLKTLVRLGERMQNLLDNLLHYSRVGRLNTENETVEASKVVQEVTDLLQPLCEERKVELRIPRNLPSIYCNPIRLGEIFRNLITNAIQFNDKSDKWVEIGYEGDANGSRELVFFIRDNGVGISKKDQEEVFSIFRKAYNKDLKTDGIGAGLTITKKIVEHYNGKIWFESEEGVGSTFYFTLTTPEESTIEAKKQDNRVA